MKLYYVTNIFDLQIFVNETTAFLKFFEICKKMYFLKSALSQLFPKYSEIYFNLNVKNSPKFNGPLK